MNFRLMQAEDYEVAKTICESRGFLFPAASEIVGALVATDPDVIAVGVIRRIHEAIIAVSVDESCQKARRAEAFTGLIKQGRFYSEAAKIDQWHAFVEDPEVARTLKLSFGFKECKGTPMILDFRGNGHGQK